MAPFAIRSHVDLAYRFCEIHRQSSVNQSPDTKTAAALEFIRQTEGWGRMATDGTGVCISVRVLGEIAIAYDGTPLPLPESLRAVALLGWLAVHGGSRTRSEIAWSLWPDVPTPALATVCYRAVGASAGVRRTRRRRARYLTHRIGLRGVEIDLQRFDELVAAD
jgi:hypothetical protein